MDVRRVALPTGLVPYSSWNSSLCGMFGSSRCAMACENGAVISMDACDSDGQVQFVNEIHLGPVGLERFCHAWSTPTHALAVAHGDTLSLYDDKFDRQFELQLPFFAKHVAFHGTKLIVSTSNGAYLYHVCQKSLQCTLSEHMYRDVPVGVSAISPCGAHFGIAAIDGRVTLWDGETINREFSTTLSSSRPTSVAFSGEYAVVACKDGHVAIFQHEKETKAWSSSFCWNFRPDTAASGYLSSTLVAFWPALPSFFCVVHSSFLIEIVDASSGRRVHHVAFPSHVHFMGLVALDDILLAQDSQGNLYSIAWAFHRAIAGRKDVPQAIAVHTSELGTLYLERQVLRRVARPSQVSDVIPMPFVPPRPDKDLKHPTRRTLSAHWILPDCVCVTYGDAVYRYCRGKWDAAVVPTGVRRIAYTPHDAAEVVVWGHDKLAVLSLDTLETLSVHAMPADVAQRDAFDALSATIHVHREESALVVRLMDHDVELWRHRVLGRAMFPSE
ncbi:hypothetical protein H310_12249 [Aphanomyces invadans]|uniref:Uncharacterized protein n=1 Tax=Aphanomyces invadans TaxID=157072 RepID=A0A024TIF4_9STRA|nr:hypothetical protein H310_12249 [Aphanomyces invadans]ETV93905.1 hypothetical protein H310_12249 [Aphanomyces invadans]|eukprot:XP_008877465.1 hypothetical protein H310_12249 [Aphanomyces invadans]